MNSTTRTANGVASATYIYKDEDGREQFKVKRVEHDGRKDFPVWTKNGTGWKSGRKADPLLYGLPEIRDYEYDEIWITEGEKNTLDMRKAYAVCATTPMGAAWQRADWEQHYIPLLDGFKRCNIVVDWDTKGLQKAKAAYDALTTAGFDVALWKSATAKEVRKSHGEDASDHIAAGYGLADFVRLTELAGASRKAADAGSGKGSPESARLARAQAALRDLGCERHGTGRWDCPFRDDPDRHDDGTNDFTVKLSRETGELLITCTCRDKADDPNEWFAEVCELLGLADNSGDLASWLPVDLTAALSGKRAVERPAVGLRVGETGLFYHGRTHAVSGEPEAMKTWLCLASAVAEMAAGNAVVYIDFEDDENETVARLLALGATAAQITKLLVYIRPEEPIKKRFAGLAALLRDRTPSLAVIDGVTEGMTLHGLDPLGNKDAAEWLLTLPRPLADLGPAVVQIDHLPKDQENQRKYAIGAQHKLAGISGANYLLKVRTPLSRGGHGIARLTVTKDRPGWVREVCEDKNHSIVGDLHLVSDPEDGAIDATIVEPEIVDHDADTTRPDDLMAQFSEYIAANPGLSGNSIKGTAKGKAERKQLALELLRNEGYVRTEASGRTEKHYSVKLYIPDMFKVQKSGSAR